MGGLKTTCRIIVAFIFGDVNTTTQERITICFQVPKRGLEPPLPYGNMTLNHARLPIPPLRRDTQL